MERTHFNLYALHQSNTYSTITLINVQLGLQTAPVLLFFHPTTGPHAVADAAPLRYDFTNGYV
jgi:hypothetical protein